jgi:hypothetical protein
VKERGYVYSLNGKRRCFVIETCKVMSSGIKNKFPLPRREGTKGRGNHFYNHPHLTSPVKGEDL